MRARSISTIAAAFVTLAALFLVGTLTTEAAGQKKGGKGKKTPTLMRVEFRNQGADSLGAMVPAHIRSDGLGEYVDERATVAPDPGVEAFLGGDNLGHFELRLEESAPARTVTLDFGKPVLEPDGSLRGCLLDGFPEADPDEHFLSLEIMASVRSLANIGVVIDGNVDYSCGLGCISPGERRASGLYLRWDEPLTPNTRVGVVFRNRGTSSLRGPHEVMITRCGGASEWAECKGITTIPENTWIISTRHDFIETGAFTGPRACVWGNSIKGKPKNTNYGIFEMPFELVMSCVNSDCS